MALHLTWFFDQTSVVLLSSVLRSIDRKELVSRGAVGVGWAASRNRKRVRPRGEYVSGSLREDGGVVLVRGRIGSGVFAYARARHRQIGQSK